MCRKYFTLFLKRENASSFVEHNHNIKSAAILTSYED